MAPSIKQFQGLVALIALIVWVGAALGEPIGKLTRDTDSTGLEYFAVDLSSEETYTSNQPNIDLFARDSHLEQDAPVSLARRSSTTVGTCQKYNDDDCKWQWQEATCFKGTDKYQVVCAGCYPHNDRQKPKDIEDCPKDTRCIQFEGANPWGETAQDVACVPASQTRFWQNRLNTGGPSKSGLYCSGGVVNNGGRDYKVEAVVNTRDSHGLDLISAGSIRIVLNAQNIDSAYDVSELVTDFTLRPRSSVQGCFEPKSNLKQELNAVLGLRILS